MFKEILLALILTISISFGVKGEEEIVADSSKVYEVTSIYVSGEREKFGLSVFPTTKDNFNKVLNVNGFNLIRKGTFFAQDIYSEGYKREDITVVVDGERYHSACPNRMDSPLTRVNPLEMKLILLDKKASSLYSGLAGGVEYRRSIPSFDNKITLGLGNSSVSSNTNDVALSVNGGNHLFTGQYSTGKGYDDADDNGFVENYNYKEEFRYKLGEFSLRGVRSKLDYRVAFTYTDNVMFPYLKMDERQNRVYSSYLKYDKYKLYFNYTDHLMDNNLRVSPMYMVSDAKNYTIGISSDNFELFYRNWNTENKFVLPNGMVILNHMIPDVSVMAGTYQYKYDINKVSLSAKAGLRYITVGDEDRLTFYQPLYDDVEKNNLYYNLGLNGSYFISLPSGINGSFSADLSVAEPEIEKLFIAVQKPMGNPPWIGNPTLDQPLKIGSRSSWSIKDFDIELYASYVWNYINHQRVIIESLSYQTYKNIDASIVGINFNYSNQFLQIMAGYTFGTNQTDNLPLAEIAPFNISTTIKSPNYKNFEVSLTHTYNDSQNRVDSTQAEIATSSWHRLDATISYITDVVLISMNIDNITNETYYHHLSYQRSPFSAGMPVNEPGLTIRTNFLYNFKL